MRIASKCASLAALVLAGTGLVPAAAGAVTPASGGSFYTYTGTKPLAAIKPGTVLKSRTVSYHVAGIAVPLKVVQLLYRSTGELGQATANVTSVIEPPVDTGVGAVSYQSFYDSLSPADEPSRQIAGGVTLGGLTTDAETLFIAPELLLGLPVIVPDTEGQNADFAAGPEYGTNTLDSIRAATRSALTGLNAKTKVALLGYSGGAIATDWAAQLAPSYAPAVNRQLVGAAEGGVFVDPAHNLRYVSGSAVWSGTMVMALVGIARSAHISVLPYLSAYGKTLYNNVKGESIAQVLGAYPGLTFAQLVKPRYANPNSIPVLVKEENVLNMGLAASATTPMFIGQGTGGVLEGTPAGPKGIGPGDGVMVAGDVRSLARKLCAAGTRVEYTQYPTSHVTTVPLWAPPALAWIAARFAGGTAPSDCSSIAPGNSLAAQKVAR